MLKNAKIYIVLVLFHLGCVNSIVERDNEKFQIENYIEGTGLSFKKLPSGVYLHVYYQGKEPFYTNFDSVTIIYDAYNLDKKSYIFKNDTFKFLVGDKNLLEGLTQSIKNFGEGGVGKIIFPYYKAYGNSITPVVDPYSTLIIDFKVKTDSYILEQFGEMYKFSHDKYFKLLDKFDSLLYAKIFIPSYVEGKSSIFDIILYTLNGTKIFERYLTTISSIENLIPSTVPLFCSKIPSGSLIIAFLNPYQCFQNPNPYNVNPYQALYCIIRASSNNSQIENKSIIERYVLTNNYKIAFYIENKIGVVELKKNSSSNKIKDYDVVKINEKITNLANNTVIYECKECTKIISPNDLWWKYISLKATNVGEHKIYIVNPTEQQLANGPIAYEIEILQKE